MAAVAAAEAEEAAAAKAELVLPLLLLLLLLWRKQGEKVDRPRTARVVVAPWPSLQQRQQQVFHH